MQDYSLIGSFIIKSSNGTRGQIVPLPSIYEDSVEAQLILLLEEAYSSPNIHKDIHNGLHQILRSDADFGNKVQLVAKKEETGWRIAFVPNGWNTPVSIGLVDSISQSSGDEHGYYLQHHRGLLETTLDYLKPGKTIVIGREADIPGLNQVGSLSRQHVSIRKLNDNLYQVQDLQSKNGTFALIQHSNQDRQEWVKLEKRTKLKGGTLISLGSSSKSFQFTLPESYDHELLQWKSIVVNLCLTAQAGEVFSVICPYKVSRLTRQHQFEIMREVRWSFLIHLLSNKERIFHLPNNHTEGFQRCLEDISIDSYHELRFDNPQGNGFILPGPCLKALVNTLPGKVISVGADNFVPAIRSIEPHHLGILILDRNNFMLSNKSVLGSVYYRYSGTNWRSIKEMMRVPAGTDIMLGTPGDGVSFTLPSLSTETSSTSIIRSNSR
jgi:hypothetical protein